MSSILGEPIRAILVTILITITVSIAGTVYKIGQESDFEQQAVSILNKEGGTTASALKEIDKLSNENYFGDFTISEVNGDFSIHDFGDKVYYRVDMHVPYFLFSNGNMTKITIKNEQPVIRSTISQFGGN